MRLKLPCSRSCVKTGCRGRLVAVHCQSNGFRRRLYGGSLATFSLVEIQDWFPNKKFREPVFCYPHSGHLVIDPFLQRITLREGPLQEATIPRVYKRKKELQPK